MYKRTGLVIFACPGGHSPQNDTEIHATCVYLRVPCPLAHCVHHTVMEVQEPKSARKLVLCVYLCVPCPLSTVSVCVYVARVPVHRAQRVQRSTSPKMRSKRRCVSIYASPVPCPLCLCVSMGPESRSIALRASRGPRPQNCVKNGAVCVSVRPLSPVHCVCVCLCGQSPGP